MTGANWDRERVPDTIRERFNEMEYMEKYEVINRNDENVKYEIEVNNEFPFVILIEQKPRIRILQH